MGKSRRARKRQLPRSKPVPPHDSAAAIAEAEVFALSEGELTSPHDSVFRTLISNLADAVFAHDLEGNLVIVNDASCRSTGYSEEELLGMTVADIDADSSSRDDRQKFWQVMKPGDTVMIKVRHRRRDGTEYPAEVHLNRIELGGQPIILAVARDLTDLLRAQETQHRTRQMLLQSQRIAHTGSFCHDLKTGRVTWSDELYRIFGYAPRELELTFERVVEHFHPEDRERFVRTNRELVESNRPYDAEYRCVRTDGVTIWVRSRAELEFDECGQPARMIGAVQDITDTVTMRQEREHERQLMLTMLETSPEAMFLIKTDGTIVAANRSLSERFNLTVDELVGRSVYSLLSDDVAISRRERIAEVIRTRRRVAFEDRRDGMILYHTLEPVLGADGEVECVAIHGADLSDIRKTEKELEHKQLLLTQAELLSNSGAWEWDVARRCLYGSEGWQRIHGITKDVITYDELMTLAHPEDREMIGSSVVEALGGQGEYDVQHRIIRAETGETRYVRSRGVARRDAQGNLTHVIGSSRDVTKQYLAREALAESERFAQMIADTTPSLLYVYDIDKDCNVWINAASREFLRESIDAEAPEQGCRDTMSGMVNPEDFPALVNRLEQLANSPDGTWVEVEYRYRLSDGSWRWFSDRAAAFERHPDGSLSKVIGSAIDINETRNNQERLTSQVQFLQRLMDTIPNPLYYQDSDGRMMGCNRAFEEFFGRSCESVAGSSFGDLCPGETRTDIIHKDRELRARGGTQVFETRVHNKDNEPRSVVLYRASFDSAGHTATGIIGVLIDITDRRRMERELFKAEKLDSIGVLAGGIAHDFNNILVAILGNISLARMEVDERGEIDEMLAAAEKATERARHLTHQLLTFSKGGSPIRKVCNIGEMLRETAEFALRGSNARGEFLIDEGLKPSEVDEGQFTQVINNLVINAIQAMPTGGVAQIAAENFQVGPMSALPLSAGSYVRISISDQGIGISPQNLSRIFDPFFTTKDSGSGLGLASCYSIIKGHNGHIEVTSRLGVGSTFTVYLPATTEKATVVTATTQDIPTGVGRILVLDDEEPLRRLTSQALQRLGYSPEVAASGDEAIAMYRRGMRDKEPFAVVILDLTVPGGMGGQSVLRELKRLNPTVRAVVTSGYSSDPVLANYRQRGFCGRMIKPFKVSDLARVVKEAMSEDVSA